GLDRWRRARGERGGVAGEIEAAQPAFRLGVVVRDPVVAPTFVRLAERAQVMGLAGKVEVDVARSQSKVAVANQRLALAGDGPGEFDEPFFNRRFGAAAGDVVAPRGTHPQGQVGPGRLTEPEGGSVTGYEKRHRHEVWPMPRRRAGGWRAPVAATRSAQRRRRRVVASNTAAPPASKAAAEGSGMVEAVPIRPMV